MHLAAAHGLHGLHLAAAHGLHGLHLAAAHGLQAPHVLGAHGLHPAAIWIEVTPALATATGKAIAVVARVATLRATIVFLSINASKKTPCR